MTNLRVIRVHAHASSSVSPTSSTPLSATISRENRTKVIAHLGPILGSRTASSRRSHSISDGPTHCKRFSEKTAELWPDLLSLILFV